MRRTCTLVMYALIGLLALPLAQARAALPDFAVASDVLVYVNDGLGSADELNARLQALTAPPGSTAVVAGHYAELRNELMLLLTSFRAGQEMPWTMPKKLSALVIARVDADVTATLADSNTLLEYMNFQYLAKAYFGVFEYGPPGPSSLGARNEAELIAVLGSRYAAEPGKSAKALSALNRFIENIDYERAGIVQKDGKPLTPLSFYRAVRLLQQH